MALEIPVAEIEVGERLRRDLGDIQGLAESIRRLGLINPITVKETSRGYKLLAGYRRLTAAKMLGWETIPATVRNSKEVEP